MRGDIALIDHLDIDRVSAEELIAAGAVAVLNCRPSSGGTYPNLGPQLLVEAGICSWTCPTTRCSSSLSDGDPLVISGRRSDGAPSARSGEVLRNGELLARGEVLDLERVCAETELRRQ